MKMCVYCKYLDDSQFPTCYCNCEGSTKFREAIFVGEKCCMFEECDVSEG